MKFSDDDNIFCVPKAVSILTGRSISESCELLRLIIGDEPISGVFVGAAIKVLKSQFLNVRELGVLPNETVSQWNRRNAKPGISYFCHSKGHVFVFTDGIIYDNRRPYGVSCNETKYRLLGIYEVIK